MGSSSQEEKGICSTAFAPKVLLRGYQKDSSNSILRSLNKGEKPLLVSPTGSGKTVILAEVARRVVVAGASLVAVSHRREINEQLHKRLGCPVYTIQELVSRYDENQVGLPGKLSSPSFQVCLIDEAHHYQAEEWSLIFEMFGDIKFAGATATPVPGMGDVFDSIHVAAHYPDLVRAGYLSKCRLIRPASFCGPDLGFNVVEAYQKFTPGERAFLFAPSVEASSFYADCFNKAGVKAVHLDGKTPKAERAATLELFREWGIDVICNVGILTEGIDVPEASCCILAGNSSNAGSYVQKTGRVLRPHPSKNFATIIDPTGSSWIYDSPIAKRDYSLTTGVGRWDYKDSVRDCPQCAWGGGVVAVCPSCSWNFLENRGRKKRAQIFSKEMLEHWCGEQTPKKYKDQEWTRLSSLVERKKYSIYKACLEYKNLFKKAPPLTEDQKMDLYFGMVHSALKKKQKIGAAFYRYRSLLSEKPNHQWVSVARESKRKGAQTSLFKD